MNGGGITKKIIQFSNSIVGHIRGGLGLANIGASMIFAGISGTATADVASIGAIMIPSMKEEGYDVEYSAAVTASSSTIGPIIPPSLNMIIVGTLTGVSVGKLFLAGVIPGVLLGGGQMIVAYYLSMKRNYPKNERSSFREIFLNFKSAFWALMLTFIILYGILGGIFTPTEASIISAIYAFVVGAFVYKGVTLNKLPSIMRESMIMTAAIMLLIGFANIFAWILTREQIPQLVANSLLSITTNKFLLLILINMLLLFVGTFMETISALLILFPVLLGVITQVGVDPIQFGVIAVLNLVIGLTTPPVGICLFIAASIGRISLSQIVKAILPFLAVSLIVLLLTTFVPAITLFLPNLFLG